MNTKCVDLSGLFAIVTDKKMEFINELEAIRFGVNRFENAHTPQEWQCFHFWYDVIGFWFNAQFQFSFLFSAVKHFFVHTFNAKQVPIIGMKCAN